MISINPSLKVLFSQMKKQKKSDFVYNPISFSFDSVNNVDPEYKLAPAKTKFGEIVGYRLWVLEHPLKLTSVTAVVDWQPNIIINDRTGFGAFINVDNYAGVWAFKNWELLNLNFLSDYTEHLILVFGTIWMWGKVIEHEQGYRSEYASIRSIDRVNNTSDNLGDDIVINLQKKFNVGFDKDIS